MKRTDDILASDEFWIWARVTFIALCLIVGVALASGCTRTHSAHVRDASSTELQSTVTLMAQSEQWVEPALSSDGFGVSAGHMRVSYEAYCSAFAMRMAGTLRVLLVTAAHCLERGKLAVGDEARYRTSGTIAWGLGSAIVSRIDPARDYAELEPRDVHELVPLEMGRAPEEGAYVTSPSAFFRSATAGRVQVAAIVPQGRFLFSGRIAHGWSGSPVLDAQGRAVGVVTSCLVRVALPSKCIDGVFAGAL